MDNTFKQMSVQATHTVVDNQDTLQTLIKEILLENPVVKYPFLINPDGSFIFPFSRKATFLKGTVITPEEILFNRFAKHTGKSSTFYRLFKQAENYELKERKCPEAIQYYLEALDYLLRHIKKSENEGDQQRFDRVRTREGLEKLSELDIDLRWKYFDVVESGLEKNEKGENSLTFQKLRKFYLPTDAKTLFYKEVKELKLWTRSNTLYILTVHGAGYKFRSKPCL